MTGNNENRDLEKRLADLQPLPISLGLEQQLESIAPDISGDGSSVAKAQVERWNATTWVWLSAAASVVLVALTLGLSWIFSTRPPEVAVYPDSRDSVIRPDQDFELPTLANFSYALKHGEDLDELLQRQSDRLLPSYPLGSLSSVFE